MKKRASTLILISILLISLAGMLHFGDQKEGYHVDELYSYGLANSEYLPFMHFGESGYDVADWMGEYGSGSGLGELISNIGKDYRILKSAGFKVKDTVIYQDYLVAQANSSDTRTTSWVSGQAYRDYLTTNDRTRFNLFSVYYNQRGDVHPPLFYLLLNFTSSLFPGVFSKWFGIVNNMIFMVITLITIYLMGRKHLGGEMPALLFCVVFGWSSACMSTVVFLRMYALLLMWVVLALKVHLDLAEKDYEIKGLRGQLVFTVLLGYMTHYYFVLYIISLCLVTSIVLAVKKRWKTLGAYIGTLALTAAGGILIWPFSIKHVFGSYRGRDSLNALGNQFYFIKVKVIWEYMCELLFNGHKFLPLVLIGLALVSMVIPIIGKEYAGDNKKKLMDGMIKLAMVFVPAVVYILLVPQIVPFLTDRYFMPLFPFIMFAAVGSYYLIVYNLSLLCGEYEERIRTWGKVIGPMALLIITTYQIYGCEYLYIGGQETAVVPENTKCVYVLPDGSWNASAEETNVLAQCEAVAVVYEEDIQVLEGTVLQEGEKLMITIQEGLEEEAIVDKVKRACDADSYVEVMRSEGNECLRIVFGEN